MRKHGKSSAPDSSGRRSAGRRRLTYIALKARYDSIGQILLDGLKLIGIRVTAYQLFVEGLPLAGSAMAEQAPRFEPYGFRLLTRDDMGFIASLPDRNYSEAVLLSRLDSGCIGLGAWCGNDLAAFVWCDLRRCSLEGCHFPLKADEGYLFDVYTRREFRGRGLAPYLRWKFYGELARMGRTRLYSLSDRYNSPSLRFKDKLGAQELDSGVVIDVFRRWKFSRSARGVLGRGRGHQGRAWIQHFTRVMGVGGVWSCRVKLEWRIRERSTTLRCVWLVGLGRAGGS